MSELLYISGPMAGWPEHNYPAFEVATRNLRDAGYRILSPHELGPVGDWSWQDYLRRDLALMLSAGPSLTGIATLPDGPEFGYPPSRGRALEIHVASELGLRVAPVEWWLASVDFTVPVGASPGQSPWWLEGIESNRG